MNLLYKELFRRSSIIKYSMVLPIVIYPLNLYALEYSADNLVLDISKGNLLKVCSDSTNFVSDLSYTTGVNNSYFSIMVKSNITPQFSSYYLREPSRYLIELRNVCFIDLPKINPNHNDQLVSNIKNNSSLKLNRLLFSIELKGKPKINVQKNYLGGGYYQIMALIN